MFQDAILPTSAYVAGPAEIAYFAQSEVLYRAMLGRPTAVLPRFSATLVEPKIATMMARHELRLPDVLMGDINEWFLWGRPLRWLHRRFGYSPAPATFPVCLPMFALDRIWIRPQERMHRVAAHVSLAARMASDHLPLLALIDD